MKIGIVGAGFVGLTFAAVLGSKNYQVLVLDVDNKKLKNTKMIFRRKITYAKKIPEALKNCECAIIMTPWNDYSKPTSKDFRKMKKRVIIDSRRMLVNKKLDASYHALGIGS